MSGLFTFKFSMVCAMPSNVITYKSNQVANWVNHNAVSFFTRLVLLTIAVLELCQEILNEIGAKIYVIYKNTEKKISVLEKL